MLIIAANLSILHDCGGPGYVIVIALGHLFWSEISKHYHLWFFFYQRLCRLQA